MKPLPKSGVKIHYEMFMKPHNKLYHAFGVAGKHIITIDKQTLRYRFNGNIIYEVPVNDIEGKYELFE